MPHSKLVRDLIKAHVKMDEKKFCILALEYAEAQSRAGHSNIAFDICELVCNPGKRHRHKTHKRDTTNPDNIVITGVHDTQPWD